MIFRIRGNLHIIIPPATIVPAVHPTAALIPTVWRLKTPAGEPREFRFYTGKN